MDILIAIGLACVMASGLSLLIARAITGVNIWSAPSVRHFPRSIDGWTALVCIVLVILAFAVLPWPLHPAGDQSWVGHPVLIGGLVEGAFLVPAFAGLLASSPLAARAVSRETQVNSAGRLALWVASGSLLWGDVGWTGLEVLGRIVLFVAGAVAVSAAAGLGPFVPDASLSPSGAEEGLDAHERWLAYTARHMRASLALALFVVGVVPGAEVVQPGIASVIAIALFVVLIVGLRRARRTLPRLTLHAAVRWCLWRVLPVALIAIVYLELVARGQGSGVRG
jgi:hypothetical protein